MLTLYPKTLPPALKQLASPPKQLYIESTAWPELLDQPLVAIVGSRKVSPYGREVTQQLARKLAEQGVVIVSGLALGVDALAHQAALEAGGTTIAVLPGPLEKVYPASHHALAQRILKQGGALVSEYPAGSLIYKQNFIARNRLIAGLSDAVLITEAALKSGSLHTARFALEQGKDVLAVPGNITSPTSEGCNNLIKAGASPVTDYHDVLHILGLEETRTATLTMSGTSDEVAVLTLLQQGISEGEELLTLSQLGATTFAQTLTMLEITGRIRSLGANQWMLV